MKKTLLLLLSAIGLSIMGITTAGAGYVDYYRHTNGTYANSNYYTASYTYGGYSDPYYYGTGGIGSYTIGCTTYYYNTRTGTQLYTQILCQNNPVAYQSYPSARTLPYSYSVPTSYTIPTSYPTSYAYSYDYIYPTPAVEYDNYYYSYPYNTYTSDNSYCTYRYVYGAWQNACGY